MTATATLKQVHVITRHGSRTPLNKDADSILDKAGGTVLTPLGQKQMFQLGEWLRGYYNQDEFLDVYDPSLVRLESSSLDRTITSANALSMGLFPLNAQAAGHGGSEIFTSVLPHIPGPPVYSLQEHNDIFLRSYNQCPVFQKRLLDLYNSEQWAQLQINQRSLLDILEEKFPEEAPVDLKDIWNIYDMVHVSRTECEHDPSSYACTVLSDPSKATALSDSQFFELEQLMEQTENMKWGPGTARNYIGSNLLWQIMERASDEGKFFLYSTHAPTMLGFMSMFNEKSQDERFVDYGSAIIIEVYQEDQNGYWFRFLYKAASEEIARYLPMKAVDCAVTTFDGTNYCSLTKLLVWATENTLFTHEEWCTACENEMADVCMHHLLANNVISKGLQELTNAVLKDDDQTQRLIIAGTFFGGLIVGLVLMGFCCACTGCGNDTGEREKQDPQPVPADSEHAPNHGSITHAPSHDTDFHDEINAVS